MLINLTNHPVNTWDKTQINTATTIYGSIEELKFPNIPLEFQLPEIEKLVEIHLTQILELLKNSKDNRNAVHISGEFCFTYNLVKKLEKENIEAISSITTRNVVEEENGVKKSLFRFMGFRSFY